MIKYAPDESVLLIILADMHLINYFVLKKD